MDENKNAVLHYFADLMKVLNHDINDDTATLIDRQKQAVDCVIQLKKALKNYVTEKFQVKVETGFTKDTFTDKVLSSLDEIYELVFMSNEDAMELGTAQLESIFLRALVIALEINDKIDEIFNGADDLSFISNDNVCTLPYEERLLMLPDIIAKNPDNHRAYEIMARSYKFTNNPTLAIEYYEKAFNLKNNWTYLQSIGREWLKLEEWEKAYKCFKKTKELYIKEQNSKDDKSYFEICRDERAAAKGFQETDGLDFYERLAPYEEAAKIFAKLGSFFLLLKTPEEKATLASTLAFLEKYHLLEKYINEGNSFNEICPTEFRYWQPTPLYWVCANTVNEKMNDPAKMIRFLVENGADPNMPAGDGSTPLSYLCTQVGRYDLMRVLLEARANPNQLSTLEDIPEKISPLMFCLLPKTNEDGVMIDFSEDEIKKINELLAYGADPNLKSTFDFSPLMSALSAYHLGKNSIKIIKILIDNGADVNAVCELNGYSVLMLAVELMENKTEQEKEYCLEAIKLLLDKGANVNVYDNCHEKTAYVIAVENNDLRVQELLLKYGADKKAYDDFINPNRLKQMIRQLRENPDVFVAICAKDQSIITCNKELPSYLNVKSIPNDYAEFLTNYCNGLMFYDTALAGTETVMGHGKFFNLLDLPEVNDEIFFEMNCYIDNFEDRYECLYIGDSDDYNYLFNNENKKYQIRAKEGNTLKNEFANFQELFIHICAPILNIDNYNNKESNANEHTSQNNNSDWGISKEEELLSSLPQYILDDFIKFVTETELGKFLSDSGKSAEYSMMVYFAVLQIPFKGTTIPAPLYDLVVNDIINLKLYYTPDDHLKVFSSSGFYAHNLMWMAFVSYFYDSEDEQEKEQTIANTFGEAVGRLRENEGFEEYGYLSECASLYMVSEIHSKNESTIELAKRTRLYAKETCERLLRYNHLFFPDQFKIIEMLIKLLEE